MPTYDVPLWEGRDKKIFRVEAESPEEAMRLAKDEREKRFVQRHTREELARKLEESQEKADKAGSKLGAIGAGLQQSAVNVLSGTADAVTGAALAVADTGLFGEDVAESLRQQIGRAHV